MEIQNRLFEESLQYTEEKQGIAERIDEVNKLYEVSEYCSQIKEKIRYDSSILFDQEVERGITLGEWLFSRGTAMEEEVNALMLRMMDQFWKDGVEEGEQKTIFCTLGNQGTGAYDMDSYIKKRRDVLSDITDPEVYARIMQTCFLNCRFADDIADEMQNIKDFSLHTKELTLNLSVLNDEALDIYERNNHDGNLSMKELDSKLLACSPDYKNQKKLQYEFSYEMEEDGERVIRSKMIICHPHLKLVKENSDFRVYFTWKDKDVGSDRHVLVGRIGRHGWKKRR